MKKILLLGSVVALLGLGACGGSSDTAPAATDAAFPSSVGVDVSSVASSSLADVTFSVSKSGMADGTMTAPITAATNMADIVTKLTNHIFSGISTALNTELLTTSTTASGTAFDGTVKIDFANYNADVDGDGANDPCSGTAAITSTPTYACFRAWFTDADAVTSRLMIGYLKTAPTDTTSGEGVAIINPTLVADTSQVAGMGDVMAYVTWTNTTASVITFDGYMSGAVATDTDITVGRIRSESDAANKITLQTAAFFAADKVIPVPSGGGTTNVTVNEILFNSEFIIGGTNLIFEDHFYYNGASVGDSQNDTRFCGVMATGNLATPGSPATITVCTAEGIDLPTPSTYVELSVDDESKTVFPAATVFPEDPTF